MDNLYLIKFSRQVGDTMQFNTLCNYILSSLNMWNKQNRIIKTNLIYYIIINFIKYFNFTFFIFMFLFKQLNKFLIFKIKLILFNT